MGRCACASSSVPIRKKSLNEPAVSLLMGRISGAHLRYRLVSSTVKLRLESTPEDG
jgi:hypothetical protein